MPDASGRGDSRQLSAPRAALSRSFLRWSHPDASPRPTALLAAACLTTPCAAQLRVAQWNITNYSSGRVSEFQTAIYRSFAGRSMIPDVVVAEEVNSLSAATNFLNLLNGAPGSPGDWALAPFVPNSGDTSNALFYRTAKIEYLSVLTLNEGTGNGPGMPPRDDQRWRVRLKRAGPAAFAARPRIKGSERWES